MQVNLKLDPKEDMDLIEYLKDAPKTWILKKSLRIWINHQMKLEKLQSEQQQEQIEDELGF